MDEEEKNLRTGSRETIFLSAYKFCFIFSTLQLPLALPAQQNTAKEKKKCLVQHMVVSVVV
jgi:hypothetical protein